MSETEIRRQVTEIVAPQDEGVLIDDVLATFDTAGTPGLARKVIQTIDAMWNDGEISALGASGGTVAEGAARLYVLS